MARPEFWRTRTGERVNVILKGDSIVGVWSTAAVAASKRYDVFAVIPATTPTTNPRQIFRYAIDMQAWRANQIILHGISKLRSVPNVSDSELELLKADEVANSIYAWAVHCRPFSFPRRSPDYE